MGTPIDVFVSYSHADEDHRRVLEKHLRLLEREGAIRAWSDRRIGAGEDWSRTIDEQLEQARVVVLLVSVDFLASDYCYGIELDRALARSDAGHATVIPVILRACEWQKSRIHRLQAVPVDGKAITGWADQDEAWLSVAREIRRAIERISVATSAHPALRRTPTPGAVSRSAPPSAPALSERGAPSSHPGIPLPSSGDPARGQERVRSSRTIASRLLAAGVATIGVGVGIVMPLRSGNIPLSSETSPHRRPAATSRPATPGVGYGPSTYMSGVCAAPCCGGTACLRTARNSTHDRCDHGGSACEACRMPEITCIPGACDDQLLPGERFVLRFSYVAELDAQHNPVPGCAPNRRIREVCFRRHDDASPTCIPTEEACGNFDRPPEVFDVTTEDLTRYGIDISLRGSNGSAVAHRDHASYTTMSRTLLCSGLLFDRFENDGVEVKTVGFFLEPR